MLMMPAKKQRLEVVRGHPAACEIIEIAGTAVHFGGAEARLLRAGLRVSDPRTDRLLVDRLLGLLVLRSRAALWRQRAAGSLSRWAGWKRPGLRSTTVLLRSRAALWRRRAAGSLCCAACKQFLCRSATSTLEPRCSVAAARSRLAVWCCLQVQPGGLEHAQRAAMHRGRSARLVTGTNHRWGSLSTRR